MPPAVDQHDAEGLSAGGIEMMPTGGGHLRVGPAAYHVAAGGHHEGRHRPGGGAVLHGDGRGTGVVEVVALSGAGHGAEVAVAHGLVARQGVPAAFVGAAHVAGDEVGLHGAGSAHTAARQQAAIDVVALAALKGDGLIRAAVGIDIDSDERIIKAGHHSEAGVVEVAGGGGFTQRDGVGGAPTAGGVHLVRAAEERGGAVGPSGLGDGNGEVAAQAVAAVEINDGLQKCGIHVVLKDQRRGG